MGPSGAGKTTLMNILAGFRVTNMEGEIIVNGEPRDLRQFRKMSCYIMQKDELLPNITVKEAMTFCSRLKLGRRIDEENRQSQIMDILERLSLDEAAHTRTMQLSGGQKKRLAIAQELINKPQFMFFDEPTSGLDSSSCLQCIQILRQLCHQAHRNIICTIHQPSYRLLQYFDHLYFMGDGNCLYEGSIPQLVPYLSSQGYQYELYHNPSDFFMELICGDQSSSVIERLTHAHRQGEDTKFNLAHCSSTSIEKFKATSEADTLFINNDFHYNIDGDGGDVGVIRKPETTQITEIELKFMNLMTFNSVPISKSKNKNISNCPTMAFILAAMFVFCNQSWLLFYRAILSLIRDPLLTRIRLVAHLLLGFIIGLLYMNVGRSASYNNIAFLFFCVVFLMFTSIMPTSLTFPIELQILKREHLNYWYNFKPFFVALNFFDVPLSVICPTTFGCIVYWLSGQPAEFFRFSMFILVLVLISLVGQSIGLLVGSVASLQSAVFLAPITAIPMMLFAGFFVTLENIPKYFQWISYLSYTRYGFTALLEIIYGFDRKIDMSGCSAEKICLDANTIFKLFNSSRSKLYQDLIAITAFMLAFRILCYFLVRYKLKKY